MEHALTLWYEKPAEKWVEALPIGNGRLGAMIFGEPKTEHLQVNEETIWTGKPHDYARKGAYLYLDTIRKLIAEGRQKEAEELAMDKFMSDPLRQKEYQPFYDLYLDFGAVDPAEVESYRRALDLDQALATVDFSYQGVQYHREYLASHPHQAIAVHLSADKPGMISFSAALGSAHEEVEATADGEGLVLKGRVQPDGIRFQAQVVVKAVGGTVTAVSDSGQPRIEVRAADSATVLLVGASSFVSYRDPGDA